MSEPGTMSSLVISNQSIPFSNKSKKKQYKLNDEVQYRLNLTKRNDKIVQLCPCAKHLEEADASGESGLSGGGAHVCTCGGRKNTKGAGREKHLWPALFYP